MVKGPIGLCRALFYEVFIPNFPIDFYTSFLTTHFGPVTRRDLVKIAQIVELIRYQLSAAVVQQQVMFFGQKENQVRTKNLRNNGRNRS